MKKISIFLICSLLMIFGLSFSACADAVTTGGVTATAVAPRAVDSSGNIIDVSENINQVEHTAFAKENATTTETTTTKPAYNQEEMKKDLEDLGKEDMAASAVGIFAWVKGLVDWTQGIINTLGIYIKAGIDSPWGFDLNGFVTEIRRNNESMVHTSVFIQLKSSSKERLTELQADISMELIRSKISYDRLLLQQKEGFIATLPFGRDMFGNLFERVMPISSAANLYPLNYSGKTDEKGLYIGKDKYGSSICVDFDVRSDDKTNSNIVILGNAGEGKSFLLKLILTNLRESGFDILNIDPNVEYVELTNNLGGVNIDLMGGKYTINPLEPTPWATDDNQTMLEVEAFSKTSALSQHISYLKDFFRCYKDFSDAAIDTLELMLGKLYAKFNIFENTNLDKIPHNKFPLLTDLYAVIEEEYDKCEKGKKALYRSDTLQDLLLGLNSLCRGAESKYFNGHTNIKDGKMINFLIRGIMDTNAKLRDTILFNLLSYIQNRLLTKGRTFAGVDELHLFLNNLTTVKYLRAIMKQDRKMDSGLIIASQNVEDLTLPGIKEYTKPLLSIPTHQFFFYPGIVSSENFIDTLQLDPAEYKLINKPSRSHCLYRCGNERYLLKVIAPPYKAALFGTGGGR